MGIHLQLGGDDWGIIFTWDSFQPSTPALYERFGHYSHTPGRSGRSRLLGERELCLTSYHII